jgi:oxygen-independent coproporphyrinogen-3 oxidase
MRGHLLSEDDIERRWIIGRIMCHGRLDSAAYRERFGHEFAQRYRSELAALGPAVADGLVTVADDGSLAITPLGRLLVRNVAMHFDAYLPEQQRSGKRMFSQTV